jgi:hypothetical protein
MAPVGEDWAAPLRSNGNGELLATTLLSRDALLPERRKRRNEGKAKARNRRRIGRTAERYQVNRRRPPPSASEWEE